MTTLKARLPWKNTNKQQKAMIAEIDRQIAERDAKYINDFDAMVLYTLHIYLGFGKKRLRQFYEAFVAEHKKLVDFYNMPNDGAWLCDHMLKQIGVDVEEWNKECRNERDN